MTIDATALVTNGLWTSGTEEGTGDTIYITQLEVVVTLEEPNIRIEIDA